MGHSFTYNTLPLLLEIIWLAQNMVNGEIDPYRIQAAGEMTNDPVHAFEAA